jgi:hypothetical protein
MDTGRHVSIAQPTSVAMLGLLDGHVRSQGNRDSTKAASAGQERGARCDAAGEGLTRHPQLGTAELPEVYGGQRSCFHRFASLCFPA